MSQESLEEMVRGAQDEGLGLQEEVERLQQVMREREEEAKEREARVTEKEREMAELLKAIDTLRSKVSHLPVLSSQTSLPHSLATTVRSVHSTEHQSHHLPPSPLPTSTQSTYPPHGYW